MSRPRSILTLFVLLVPAIGARAEFILVPAERPTIQAAIDDAVDGDVIGCLPGTYLEAIDFKGKAIAVVSLSPTETTIDATGLQASAVTFTGGEGAASVLQGFTITGGAGTMIKNTSGQLQPVGGGLYVVGGSPTITDCIFRMNAAFVAGVPDDFGDGGGAYVSNGSPTFSRCDFIDNLAGDDGGGIYVELGSPVITDCTFIDQTAGDKGGGLYHTASHSTVTGCLFDGNAATDDGGGMYNTNFSEPVISGCTFSGNTAGDDGGGVRNSGSHPVISDSTFVFNMAGDEGGGVRNSGGSEPVIRACLFEINEAGDDGGAMASENSTPTLVSCALVGNTAVDEGGALRLSNSDAVVVNCTIVANDAGDAGGGVHSINGSDSTIANGIIWGNTAATGPELFTAASTPTLRHCDVAASGGSGVAWDDTLGLDGGGNIALVPSFVDPLAGDWRLAAGSPCIDAGDAAMVPADATTDLDGLPRFVDVPESPNNGAGPNPHVDLGAFERQNPPAVLCDADLTGDGLVGPGDVEAVIAAFGQGGGSADLTGDGAIDVDDIVAVILAWGACGRP